MLGRVVESIEKRKFFRGIRRKLGSSFVNPALICRSYGNVSKIMKRIRVSHESVRQWYIMKKIKFLSGSQSILILKKVSL